MAKQLTFISNKFRVTRRWTDHGHDGRRPDHMRHVMVGVLVCTLFTITPTMTWSATLDSLEQTIIPESFEKQSRTIKLISYLVNKSYFRRFPLDDSFSEKVLNRFIDRLDPAKSFFLQEDIDRFETIKYEFDDYIKRGALEPVYRDFQNFQEAGKPTHRVCIAKTRTIF